MKFLSSTKYHKQAHARFEDDGLEVTVKGPHDLVEEYVKQHSDEVSDAETSSSGSEVSGGDTQPLPDAGTVTSGGTMAALAKAYTGTPTLAELPGDATATPDTSTTEAGG